MMLLSSNHIKAYNCRLLIVSYLINSQVLYCVQNLAVVMLITSVINYRIKIYLASYFFCKVKPRSFVAHVYLIDKCP